MNSAQRSGSADLEIERIKAEYRRRETEVQRDLYAPWQLANVFMTFQRKRYAVELLHKAGVFPDLSSECLEIGYGSLGWLGDLISWGIPENHLHGIELDPIRAARAREVLPTADLRVGDATQLPWTDNSFPLVIASTVFTSILDNNVRSCVAEEIVRVLAPGGALLWYDFKVNNPRNPHVRGVGRQEIVRLFPRLHGPIRSVTLAPPLSRLIAPRSWVLATIVELIPLLRTHLLAVLVKQ